MEPELPKVGPCLLDSPSQSPQSLCSVVFSGMPVLSSQLLVSLLWNVHDILTQCTMICVAHLRSRCLGMGQSPEREWGAHGLAGRFGSKPLVVLSLFWLCPAAWP